MKVASFSVYVVSCHPKLFKFVMLVSVGDSLGDSQQPLKSIFNYWRRKITLLVFLDLPVECKYFWGIYTQLSKTMGGEPKSVPTFS